jgi:hypothetical protein
MKKLLLFAILTPCYLSAFSQDNVSKILLSKDNGVHWTSLDIGFPKDDAVNSWIEHEQSIIAGTDRHGIYMFNYTIARWAPSNEGLPADAKINVLVRLKNMLVAAVNRGGIFILYDNEKNG